MGRRKVLLLSLFIVLLVSVGLGLYFLFGSDEDSTQVADVELSTAIISGGVDLPDGVYSEDLAVQTVVESSSLTQDNTFTLTGLANRQLVFLNDEQGNTILLGFVSADEVGEITTHTTAATMLFFALGGVYLPAESWSTAYEDIVQSSAIESLAEVIGELVVEDPTYLTDDHVRFASALEDSVEEFLSSDSQSFLEWLVPAVYAQGEFVLDTEAKSGVRIDPGFYNEVTFVNQYRRPVRMMIYEIGYQEEGEEIVYDVPKLEQYVDIPSVTKLADLASTVVELIVGKVHYGERASDVIKLIPDVASADVTFYRVYGLGWGANEVNYRASGDLLDELVSHSEEIQLITGIQEVLLPVFTWIVSFKDIEEAFGYGGQALVKELLKWFASTDGARAVLPPLQKGDLVTAGRNMFEFLAKSSTLRDEITNFLISGIAKDNQNIPVGEYVDRSAKIFAAPLKYVDLVMKYFDGAVLSAHYLAASRGEQWTIAVRPPSVSLDPPTAQLQAPTNGFFRIVVQDATDDMSFEAQWSHENLELGHFVGPATDPHAYTSEFPVGVYQTEDDVEGSDTVRAKISLIRPDGTRVELGTATASVTVKQEEHCGKGTIELPPEYKLIYIAADETDKPIFFSAAGSHVHEAIEIVPPDSGGTFTLVTGASYSENVEFYRDVVDHGTDDDYKLVPKACDPEIPWDCHTAVPVVVTRYLVTVPKDFSLDTELFASDFRGVGDFSPIYENNGDATPTIHYTCKVGWWDGSTQY